jgi:hypothetical protein
MTTGRRLFVAALVAAVLPAALASRARAAAETFSSKGDTATASFTVEETVPCGAGSVVVQTFISVLAFEQQIRNKGVVSVQSQTVVGISSFNICTNTGVFEQATVIGTDVPMSGLERATLAGTFALGSHTLVLNLTLSGVGMSQQGININRTNIANSLVTTRSNETFRNATISGSASLDGHAIPLAQMIGPVASMASSIGGQVIVIRP